MSFYPIIVIACIAFYGGYFYYTKRKNAQQAQKVNATDFKAEFVNAEQYRDKYLRKELSFLQEAMEEEKIDSFNYASLEFQRSPLSLTNPYRHQPPFPENSPYRIPFYG